MHFEAEQKMETASLCSYPDWECERMSGERCSLLCSTSIFFVISFLFLFSLCFNRLTDVLHRNAINEHLPPLCARVLFDERKNHLFVREAVHEWVSVRVCEQWKLSKHTWIQMEWSHFAFLLRLLSVCVRTPTAYKRQKTNCIYYWLTNQIDAKIDALISAMCASVVDDHFLHIGYAWRSLRTRECQYNSVGRRLAYRMAVNVYRPKKVEGIMGNALTKTKDQNRSRSLFRFDPISNFCQRYLRWGGKWQEKNGIRRPERVPIKRLRRSKLKTWQEKLHMTATATKTMSTTTMT